VSLSHPYPLKKTKQKKTLYMLLNDHSKDLKLLCQHYILHFRISNPTFISYISGFQIFKLAGQFKKNRKYTDC